MDATFTDTFEHHWEKIYAQQDTDFREVSLSKLILSYVKGETVLDAGCGSGHFSHKLSEAGHQVTAVDDSDEILAMARTYAKTHSKDESMFKKVSLLDLSPEAIGQFDTVICLDVLEHIKDDNGAYRNLMSVVKPGGRVIISVPALPILYGPKDKQIGHFRRYSKQSLTEVLDIEKVSIERMRYWNFIGVIPTIIATKLLHTKIDESFRYESRSFIGALQNTFLRNWLSIVENRIHPPLGLTLVAVVRRTD